MKSRVWALGTAIRCVSRYSESLIMREGETMEVRDLLERFPLCIIFSCGVGMTVLP